jgi:hypothetical protein
MLMRSRSAFAVALALSAVALLACADGFPPEFPVPVFSLASPLTGAVADNATIANKPAIIYWFTSW